MSLVVGVSFGHLDSSKINRLLCHKPCVAPGHVPSVMKFCMLGPPDTSMGCENIMGPACTPMFRQRFCTRSTNCKLVWPRRPFHPSRWHGRAPFVQWACRIWTAGGRVTLQLPLTSVSTTPRWPGKLGKQKCANLGWLWPKTPLCPNVKRRSLMLFGTRNSKVTTLLRLKSMISPKPLRFAIGCSTGVLTVWQFRQIPQQRFELFADAQAPTAAGAAPQAVVRFAAPCSHQWRAALASAVTVGSWSCWRWWCWAKSGEFFFCQFQTNASKAVEHV